MTTKGWLPQSLMAEREMSLLAKRLQEESYRVDE